MVYKVDPLQASLHFLVLMSSMGFLACWFVTGNAGLWLRL